MLGERGCSHPRLHAYIEHLKTVLAASGASCVFIFSLSLALLLSGLVLAKL